ncbi:MAG: PstS family phosphate ABC transporter substrate-binding protein [Deltaproteobacteria bacterium]|nr:PstS family phosphate ABC transporter substrate-binding protein [Deltaproteobacteria bacterium]
MYRLTAIILTAAIAAMLTVLVYAGPVVKIDGSSTVYPVTEAVSEEFQKIERWIKVTAGISGTGGGFKKFCNGETDISDASRPIKEVEVKTCREHGVEYIELPIAYDGLAIMVNPKNNWVDYLTVHELKKMWEPASQGKVTRWSQIRHGWPDTEMHLFGPGVDSGTFDYFTDAVVGKSGASRGDYTASEDDNVLVQGIATDAFALGYFGTAYYENNKDVLRLVPVDDGNDADGKGPFLPTHENVVNGTYQPLARPIFIYVSKKSAGAPEVKKFVEFYLKEASKLSTEVGYIPLPQKAYELARKRFEKRTTGSVFGGRGAQVGVKIEDILRREE